MKFHPGWNLQFPTWAGKIWCHTWVLTQGETNIFFTSFHPGMKIYLQRFAAYFSKLDYAAPAWQPWLSKTNLTNLDRLQNCSLRLITGQLVSTPLEALWLEVDVQSYSTWSKCLILKAIEKARHSTDDHPKRIVLDVNIPQHFQSCSSFLQKAEELLSLLPPDLQHRQIVGQIDKIFSSGEGVSLMWFFDILRHPSYGKTWLTRSKR